MLQEGQHACALWPGGAWIYRGVGDNRVGRAVGQTFLYTVQNKLLASNLNFNDELVRKFEIWVTFHNFLPYISLSK